MVMIVLLGLTVGALAVLLVLRERSLRTLRRRFAAIVDVDAEVARIRKAADASAQATREQAQQQLGDAQREAEQLRSHARAALELAQHDAARTLDTANARVSEAKAEIASELAKQEQLRVAMIELRLRSGQLASEVAQLEENLEDISFGLYKPHYTFDTPEEFKRELDKLRDQQKSLIRSDRAATFATAWTVGGSEREGAKMQKQYCKLVLRAFNGECDAAVAKVTWNNATKMEERIEKACEAINKLGQVMQISIAPAYLEMKLAELRLEHELEEKKRQIAEEQRRIREQMRDDERAQREAERAQAEAEADESRYEKALEKARLELGKARGEEHARLNAKLVELEAKLAEAHANSVRAKSMAELTKAGYVYVLSNVGSFGDGVFKIGMTRRLDPMDRVKELGDASVPFQFDVHAMVYSTDAPALECAFHQQFAARSVNLVNLRKEFFRVELDELEIFARQRGLTMSFTKLAEAREYRESVEIARTRVRGAAVPPPLPTAGRPPELAVSL